VREFGSNVNAIALTVVVSMVMLLSCADGTEAGQSLVIAHADGSPPQTQLMSTGAFDSIDTINIGNTTPTLAKLQTYDCVLAYTNTTPANATALGNVLADYVDSGGQLVLSTFSVSRDWAISGKIMTPGYSPLTVQ